MSSHFPPENREDCMIKEDGLPVGLGFGLAMNEKALGQFFHDDGRRKEAGH